MDGSIFKPVINVVENLKFCHHIITQIMLRFHRTIILLTFFLLRVTLADAMRSMDVPCNSSSLTRTFSFMSHVPGSCTRMSPILFHMSFHFTVLDCWLVYAYISRLCLPLSTCRLICRVVISGLWLVYDSFPFYDSLYLYLVVSYICGWGWGLVPHLQSTLQPPYKC